MRKDKRILALDIGDARIGVAMSDPLGISAQPLCTIERGKSQEIKDLLAIIERDHVSTVVVGLPRMLDGSIGTQAEKVLRFVEKLSDAARKKKQAFEVELWDERFSTDQAERLIQGSKLKNKARRAALDRMSAAIILDSYLLSRDCS